MKTSKKPITLVLTPGDPDGIGPEIVWKTIRSGKIPKHVSILCVGAEKPFKKLKAPVVHFDPEAGTKTPPKKHMKRGRPFVWLLPAPTEVTPSRSQSAVGDLPHLEGYQAGWSIIQATQMVLTGSAAALVTGPISKERLQKGGYLYPGHTEFLAELCHTSRVTMMLANQHLRITLVTTHLGIKDVSSHLTRSEIAQTILQTAQGVRQLWGVKKPKIAVMALNPHAGENGLFGQEEIQVIRPELETLRKAHAGQIEITGPHPADTYFANHLLTPVKKRADAVVCMYHDQGLIPVKLLDFGKTVNVTLGLPIIRTSVDHGVGFDIAGKGIADPSSLGAAIEMAIEFVQKRSFKTKGKLNS